MLNASMHLNEAKKRVATADKRKMKLLHDKHMLSITTKCSSCAKFCRLCRLPMPCCLATAYV